MNEAEALAKLLGRSQPAAEGAAPPASPEQAQPKGSVAPAEAAPGTVQSRFWLLIGAGLLACAGWIMGSVALLERWMDQGRFGVGWTVGRIDLTASLIVFGGLLGVSLLMMRLMPVAEGGRRMGVLPASALGLALGVGGVLFSLLQAWLGNHVVPAPPDTAATAQLASLLLGAVVIFFEAGVEEICFRGWLQRRLAARISPAAAVTAAAVAFSLLHVFGGARTPLSLVNIFLAGLLFGLLLLRTGSIWAAIWAHAGWNWAETGLLGLSPNPGASSYGSIVDLDLVGAHIWGGSVEGLNASIAITVVLVALILPLLAMRPQTA